MEDLTMQIVNGIAEAVNGDANCEQLMDDISLDKDGNFTVLLADLSQERLSELVAEIEDRISRWRINPFRVVDYGGGRTVKFYLKPEEEIRRLYDRQKW